MTQRDPVWDVVKFLMMLWVVWGHVYSTGMTLMDSAWEPFVSNLKIAVNMPVFFMVSGYLSRRSISDGSWGKILARSLSLFWPPFAFGVVFAVFIAFSEGWNLRLLAYPLERALVGGWFILTLASLYFASALAFKLARTERSRWILLILWYLVMIVAPTFKVKQAMHMWPYFTFGLMVMPRWRLDKNAPLSLAFGALLVCMALFEGDTVSNGMNFWCVSSYWQDIVRDGHSIFCFFARSALGLTGSIFVLWLVGWALSRFKWVSSLAVFGTTTLGIYVLHEWVFQHLSVLSCFPLPSVWRMGVAIVSFFAFHFFVWGLRKSAVLNFVFFGDEGRMASFADRILARLRVGTILQKCKKCAKLRRVRTTP